MKIYFHLNDLHSKFNKLNISYQQIKIRNYDIIKFLKIYYNNNKLKLSNENTINLFMNNYKIKTKYLLIQLENYNNVIEFKNILSTKYENIIIIEEEKIFHEKMKILSQLHMNIQDMILLERIENITEKPCVFSKLLDLKIDNVYCLTYKNSNDNKQKILSQLNKMNSNIEFVNMKNKEKYESNLFDLYKYCVHDAKMKNYDNIIIMTEDNDFNYSNFHNFLTKKTNLGDFDLLFLSGKLLDGEIYKENMIMVKTIQDSSCFVINSKVYDYFIDNVNKKWDTLDIWNQKTDIEKQINWSKNLIENFLTKYICQKRKKSYFLTPLLAYKSDSIDKENRIITYQNIMTKLCIMNSLKYSLNFDSFIISTKKNASDIILLQKHNVFSTFNIFQKIVSYDFYAKDSKLKLFNLFPLKTNKTTHKYDVNLMNDFLNHYFLWEFFATQSDNKLHFITYDDVDFVNDFKYKLNDILKTLPDNIDFITLDKQYYNSGYLISNNGCKKIMQYINENSVQVSIKDFLFDISDLLNTYNSTNNLIIFNYKIETQNYLNTIDNMNEKLNPDNFKYTDDIKNDAIDDSSKFKPLLKDNEYKEIRISNNNFYKNSNGILFRFNKDILEYHGYIKDDRINVHSLHKSLFGIKLQKQTNQKETILFYQEYEYVPYYLRKLLDLLSLKYNVIFMGKNFYNIKLNNVTYLKNDNPEDLILKVQKLYNIKKFYTNTFNLSLIISKTPGIEFNFIYNYCETKYNWSGKMYKNNGIEFMKNTIELYDNIYFFSNDKLNEFKSSLNLIDTPKNFKLNGYALKKNNKIKLGEKKNIIVSFDKHPKKVINSFKLINKKFQDRFQLILFNNDISITDEHINVLPFDEYALLNMFDQAYFYITFENQEDTYYYILSAINSYCIPIIPAYFFEFKNKFISINNFINKYNLDDIKEIYSNEKKKIIYNNLCDKIISNHVKNMFY